MEKFKDPVYVTCYGKRKAWERKDALEFFLEAIKERPDVQPYRFRIVGHDSCK